MREEVQWFAEKMDQILDENMVKENPSEGHPNHWSHKGLDYLFDLLQDEIDELGIYLPHKCLQCGEQHFPDWVNEGKVDDGPIDEVIRECCDVANFAMMIADNLRQHRSPLGDIIEELDEEPV